MKLTPSPFENASRLSRGTPGNSRRDSIHMLIAVRCVIRRRSRRDVSFCLSSGSSETTIGISRALLRLTASAVSTGFEAAADGCGGLVAGAIGMDGPLSHTAAAGAIARSADQVSVQALIAHQA